MTRSRLENKYMKSRSINDYTSFKKQKIIAIAFIKGKGKHIIQILILRKLQITKSFSKNKVILMIIK